MRLAGQLLVYPVLDTDRGRPSYLAYDGLVLGVAEMGWFFAQYLPREQDRATRGLPRCAQPNSAACRPRSSPWPATTRCATRAWPTPSGCARPGCR